MCSFLGAGQSEEVVLLAPPRDAGCLSTQRHTFAVQDKHRVRSIIARKLGVLVAHLDAWKK